jgi:hypothetical protein
MAGRPISRTTCRPFLISWREKRWSSSTQWISGPTRRCRNLPSCGACGAAGPAATSGLRSSGQTLRTTTTTARSAGSSGTRKRLAPAARSRRSVSPSVNDAARQVYQIEAHLNGATSDQLKNALVRAAALLHRDGDPCLKVLELPEIIKLLLDPISSIGDDHKPCSKSS